MVGHGGSLGKGVIQNVLDFLVVAVVAARGRGGGRGTANVTLNACE